MSYWEDQILGNTVSYLFTHFHVICSVYIALFKKKNTSKVINTLLNTRGKKENNGDRLQIEDW